MKSFTLIMLATVFYNKVTKTSVTAFMTDEKTLPEKDHLKIMVNEVGYQISHLL
jgi:hypothetical protein